MLSLNLPLQLWDVRSEEGSSDPGDQGGGKIRLILLRPTNDEYDVVRYSSGGMERGGGDVGVNVIDHDNDDD